MLLTLPLLLTNKPAIQDSLATRIRRAALTKLLQLPGDLFPRPPTGRGSVPIWPPLCDFLPQIPYFCLVPVVRIHKICHVQCFTDHIGEIGERRRLQCFTTVLTVKYSSVTMGWLLRLVTGGPHWS